MLALRLVLLTLARCLALPISGAFARVRVPAGTITTDTTWTAAAGPYEIKGDLTIATRATLTIQPATQVIVEPTAAGGAYHFTELQVKGRLVAQGTAVAPISIEPRPLGFRDAAGHKSSASKRIKLRR